MKKLLAIFGFIAITTGILAQSPLKVKSNISDVFVYLTGAQVSRTATVNLQKGENVIHFTQLTNLINAESIRVESDENITIQAVILRPPEGLSEIETIKFNEFAQGKAKILTKINRIKKTLYVYENEEDVLLSNKSIAGREKGVVIAELKLAADFYRQRLSDIYDKRFELKQEIVELRKEIYKIAKKELELQNEISKRKSTIEVKVVAPAQMSKKFTIRYFVQEAGWSPVYDIRLKDIDKPLTVTAKAKVVQNTGEDWTKINLTLSTGNPANSIVKPRLATYYLNFNNRPKTATSYKPVNLKSNVSGNTVAGYITDYEGNPLPGVSIYTNVGTNGTVSNIDGKYQLELPNGATVVNFSFIGMKSMSMPVYQLNNKTIKMNEDDISLDEVVVTGYGIKRNKLSLGYTANEKEKVKKQKPVKEYIPVNITQKMVDMEYKIDMPYTIPADGESYMVKMVDYEVPAEFEYYCVPKYSTDAYLSANIIKQY